MTDMSPNLLPERVARSDARVRRRRIVAGALVVLVAAILAVAAWLWLRPASSQAPAGDVAQRGAKGGSGGGASRPMAVVAAPARTEDVDIYLSGLGSVTPIATVTVKSRIDGQLMKVSFREGQVVRAGDVLAEIDPRPYQAALAQAEGTLARDAALLKNAMVDLDRYRTLFKQDSVAEQQLATQEALVRQYEGTVKVDQAAIDMAKLNVSYCRITAPISGRLGLRQVDPGNIVHASDQNGVVVITQLQPIGVLFTIPEDNVPTVMKRLQSGEKLPVDAWDRANSKKLASGTLMTVDNQIDPSTGTVRLKAQFPNQDYGLFPNQFVNARMLVDVRRGATVVPSAAVQRGSRGTFVYVVNADNTVSVRTVKVGPSQGDDIAIDDGVKPGEVVVTDGADKLREGAAVDVAGRAAPPAASPAGDAARKGGGQGRQGRKSGGGRKGDG
jgi:membrane fusion protein, multidrug efflux system